MLALRAGLDTRHFVGDRVVDGLVVAKFEMEEGMMLDRAPVAAEQRMCSRGSIGYKVPEVRIPLVVSWLAVVYVATADFLAAPGSSRRAT
jgi:hypothetical protein